MGNSITHKERTKTKKRTFFSLQFLYLHFYAIDGTEAPAKRAAHFQFNIDLIAFPWIEHNFWLGHISMHMYF